MGQVATKAAKWWPNVGQAGAQMGAAQKKIRTITHFYTRKNLPKMHTNTHAFRHENTHAKQILHTADFYTLIDTHSISPQRGGHSV